MKLQTLKKMSVAIATLFVMMLVMPTMAKAQTEYPLNIAGVRVTSNNCNDLSVIDGVSGTVKYDPNSNTLTLEDATIDVGDGKNCIWGGKEGTSLAIVVKGTCKLSSTTWSAVNLWRNTTISGDGELYAESMAGYSFNLDEGATLTIDRCRVDAKGVKGFSVFDQSSEAKLVIKNATVTAEGTEGSICDLSWLTLEGCKIDKPAGAVWNTSKHAVCDASGNIITSQVVIKPTEEVIEYPLNIAGVRVTSNNCNDLSVIDGVSGTVKYDPNSNTLTLEDATIDVGDGKNCIWGGKEGTSLAIVVKGTCKLSSTTWSAVNLWRNTTISGDGELYAESMAGYSFNLDEGATLTIDRCRVDAKGVKGFSVFDQSSEAKLVIKNATVTAEGTEGSICDLSWLTLEGCKIDKPAGAVWNTSKHAVCDASGNIITSQVVIKPNTIGIERISPNEPGYRSIYSIEGVKIDIPFEQLPSGVYIVDGKKVLKM